MEGIYSTSVKCSAFDESPMSYKPMDEITARLKINPQIENFVVVDDRFLDLEIIREHFVKTSAYSKDLDGISVEMAIDILNG